MPSQFLAGLISVQLEDRIVNPDLRDHSLLGPILNPEIMTGRAPYWASGAKNSSKILILEIQDVDPQNFILSSLFQNFDWVAALSTTCPHFCPGGLQVLFLLKRTKLQAESCSSWFIRNCKILFFLDFYTSYEASIASPCVVLWEIKRKRAFPKALRPALIRVRGIYCNNSCVDASFTLLW